jgi:hypothetical protein
VRVGLKPKQIKKYLNSTAARLQPNEKEEMVFSGFQLQDAEACRSERQVMKKISRWSNPTRRRNRIPAEIIILITSVASSATS